MHPAAHHHQLFHARDQPLPAQLHQAPDQAQPRASLLRQQSAPGRLRPRRLRQQSPARRDRLMRRLLWVLWLLVLAAAISACGGSVAEGNGSSTASAPALASPPATCNGSDSAVHDRGQPDNFQAVPSAAFTKLPDGLQYTDLAAGTGPAVTEAQCITVQYTGWLSNGTKIDSSRDRDGGFQLQAGKAGQVIAGWQEGILGM